MPTYNYSVGLGTGFNTIQHAITSIVADLDLGWIPTADIIINVQDGSYPGFTIPNGSLLPLLGSTYRLIIRSAGNYFPIIDFNQSLETQYVGADIGSANPNVLLENLRFQYFAVGIRAGLGSHSTKIDSCIVSNNRNAGIFIEQCNNSQIIQSVVTNGDYGIVARLCKNISLFHNTVFLNGSISNTPGVAQSAVWCQAAKDYGGGTIDSGKIHLIGNIIWNIVGTALTVFSNDIEVPNLLVSNFNNIVQGDPSRFIAIEDDASYLGAAAQPRRYVTSLLEWASLGFDQNSKSEDPKFIVPVRISAGRGKHAIDIRLLDISPSLAMVPSFFSDPAQTAIWLPSYVSSSDFSEDILGNPRQQGMTAAGANDRKSNAGFFGQDIITSPLESNDNAECSVNPLIDIIQKRLHLWYPRYKAGYFYSYERDFYLYSKKKCKTLGNLSQTTFNLPSRVDTNRPLKIYVNGARLQDISYFDVRGSQLILKHKDLNINNWDEEVEIQYSVPMWQSGAFSYSETYVRQKINQGTTRFFLTEDYVPEGPVVVTDDMSNPVNRDLFSNREYDIVWDHNEQKAELIFSQNSNTVKNAQFDYIYGEAPLQWSSSGATVTTGELSSLPVAGSFVCKLRNSGYLSQQLYCQSGESTLSWYMAATGNARVGYVASFYDSYNRDLGYVKTGYVVPSSDWTRVFLTLGATGLVTIPDSVDDYTITGIGHIQLPEDASSFLFKLESSGESFIDAVQYEKRTGPSSFHRKPFANELTIEYETSNAGFYIDYSQNITPSVTSISDGFLYIPEIPASCFNGPEEPSITTFYEWHWREGREKHIPWARLFGKDKLRRRTQFHTHPQKKSEVTVPALTTPSIDEIIITPGTPAALQGSEEGIVFSVSVVDTNGNPSANSKVLFSITDFNQSYPGLLHKKLYGAKQQLGQTCYAYLSHAGSTSLTWIPPDLDSSRMVINVPKKIGISQNGEPVSVIKTRYPVNLDFHGNVIIYNDSGIRLTTVADTEEKGYFVPAHHGEYSSVNLSYPIVPGNILVSVGGVIYTETVSANPETNQFFVDYENSKITVKGFANRIYVEYLPSYIFINQADPYKISLFHDKVFKGYDGLITVGYDFTITLSAVVTDYSNNTTVTKNFDLLAVNHLTTDLRSANNIYLEL